MLRWIALLGLVACGGSEPPAVDAVALPPAPVVAPAVAPPAAAAAKTMIGTLRYSEPPATMSVEAYNHVSFTLAVDGGASEALAATDTVTMDALKALDGKKVEIEATWEEPQAPNENEAHPIDPMTGEGQKRPGRWLVTKAHEVLG